MTIDLAATLEKAQSLVARCEARATAAGLSLVGEIGPKDLDVVLKALLRLADKVDGEEQ